MTAPDGLLFYAGIRPVYGSSRRPVFPLQPLMGITYSVYRIWVAPGVYCMVKIAPFRGIRYIPERVQNLARRLSENWNHSEKSVVRGQIFVGFRANIPTICRKYTEIWTDQTASQQVLLLSDSLLAPRLSDIWR
jgi:hypothetical protein